jgi:hypothetical protein
MWFLLLAMGAVLVSVAGVPQLQRLAVAPPREAVLALYFLVAAAIRIAVRDLKLAAWDRKARKLARRKGDRPASPLGEIGVGVGRGVVQAVAGDVLSASLSLAAALLRGAAGTVTPAPRPPRERRRLAFREGARTLACIVGVGVVCVAAAWAPLMRGRVARAGEVALRAVQGEVVTARAAAAMPPAVRKPGPAAR